jgi:PAS domain S-box-containing protein
MTPPATILLLEDSELDAELIQNLLRRSGLGLAVDRAADRRGFVERLAATRYDLILSDYQLPGFDGLAALALAREHQPDAPFIFVSGMMGEELAIETLKGGATDYILKQRLARLPAAVERALAESRERAERKRVDAERQKFVSLADNSTEFIGLCDLAGVIIYGNPVGMRLVGVDSLREFCHTPLAEFFFPEDRAFFLDEFLPAVRRDGHGETEIRFRHFKTGSPLWMICTFFLVYDADARPVALATVSRNITDRKRTADALRDADRHKDEFLAMLAHELRNPLAAISNAVRLAANPKAAAYVSDSLVIIERQATNLTRMIDDLIDVSRISQGKIELRRTVVDLLDVVNQAAKAVRPLIDHKHHELILRVAPGPLRVDADSTRLEQVIGNLLTNAAKYTEPGGRITLSAEREGDEAVVRIEDNGVGISREMLPHVFELFTQVDHSLGRSEGGLGIGLMLVKKLVEMHGGIVSAASELTNGSVFTVRLRAHDSAVEAIQDEGPSQATGGGERILVVDDNVDSATSLRRYLSIFGFTVQVAHDGRDAIDVARTYRPQVVLLDIGLPGIDGYEVARCLRKEECCMNSKIIAVSGYGDELSRERARVSGFDHHLTKPIDLDELVKLVGKEVRSSRVPLQL